MAGEGRGNDDDDDGVLTPGPGPGQITIICHVAVTVLRDHVECGLDGQFGQGALVF